MYATTATCPLQPVIIDPLGRDGSPARCSLARVRGTLPQVKKTNRDVLTAVDGFDRLLRVRASNVLVRRLRSKPSSGAVIIDVAVVVHAAHWLARGFGGCKNTKFGLGTERSLQAGEKVVSECEKGNSRFLENTVVPAENVITVGGGTTKSQVNKAYSLQTSLITERHLPQTHRIHEGVGPISRPDCAALILKHGNVPHQLIHDLRCLHRMARGTRATSCRPGPTVSHVVLVVGLFGSSSANCS